MILQLQYIRWVYKSVTFVARHTLSLLTPEVQSKASIIIGT